jgi:ribokinase
VGEIGVLRAPFDEPAGGGAVSAVRLAELGARVTFFTALGGDERGDRTIDFLEGVGVEVRAGRRPRPHPTALTVLDAQGERTILVAGANIHPTRDDDLGWDDLAGFDGAYFTGEDPATLEAARAARVLVVTARRLEPLRRSDVVVDALIGSGRDAGERLRPDDERRARTVVRTLGSDGGTWQGPDGEGRFEAAPLPGPVVDAYGAGDAFLAGATYGLAAGQPIDEALAIGSRLGAEAVTRRGAYGMAFGPTPQ